MPATKTKSPALAPRLQVPSVLIAPGGLRVLTLFGEGACARLTLDAMAIAVVNEKAARRHIGAPQCGAIVSPAEAHARWRKRWTAYPRQSPAQARSTVASAGPPPAGTHAGQAASFWVEPSARRRAGV